MPAGAQGVLRGFWRNMATELFTNVRELFEQIDAQFTDQSPEESVGAQMAAFCVYSCALHLSYLYKHPTLCPETDYRSDALRMLHRTLEILDEMKNVWPLASHWVEGLSSFLGGTVLPEGNMAEGVGYQVSAKKGPMRPS